MKLTEKQWRVRNTVLETGLIVAASGFILSATFDMAARVSGEMGANETSRVLHYMADFPRSVFE